VSLPEIKEGTALRLRDTGPSMDESRNHICVVVKDDDAMGDYYLVPICSQINNLHDKTCTINANEWRPVFKASFIAYYHGKKVGKANTQNKIARGEIQYLGNVPASLYSRIKAGVETSKNTDPWFKNAVFPKVKKVF
jgi:hypothetical protein